MWAVQCERSYEYDILNRFQRLRTSPSNYLYTNCITIVENTKKRLQQNANYDMCIDDMLFNIWEEVN